MKTGELIKAARTAFPMAQVTLGKAIGVSQWTISQWEMGHERPNIRQIELIANRLGVEPMSLVGEDGTREMKNEDEPEKVGRLNGTIVQKNEKIKELEDTICDQWEEIERLKKELAEANEKLKQKTDPDVELLAKNQKMTNALSKVAVLATMISTQTMSGMGLTL